MKTADDAKFHIVLVKGWVKKDDQFLIAKRSREELQAGGEWFIPGGKVEDVNETDVLLRALKEEIKEEVNLSITDSVELIWSNSFTRKDGAHVVGLTFLCHYENGQAKPLEETSEVKWVDLAILSSMKDGVAPYFQTEIDRLFKYLDNR